MFQGNPTSKTTRQIFFFKNLFECIRRPPRNHGFQRLKSLGGIKEKPREAIPTFGSFLASSRAAWGCQGLKEKRPSHTRPPSGAPTHENEQKPTTCWLQNTCLKNKAAERSRVKKEKVSHANTTQKKEGFTTRLENEATLTLKGGEKSPEIRRPILS